VAIAQDCDGISVRYPYAPTGPGFSIGALNGRDIRLRLSMAEIGMGSIDC